MGNRNSRGRKNAPPANHPNRPASAPLYPTEPPPPYTPTAQPPYSAQSMAYGMNQGYPQVQPGPPRLYPTATMQPVIHAHFDSGARFDGITQVTIPPPPPGVYPNAAQIAAAHGHKVILEKKKNSFLGERGAGYTFW